MKSAFSGSRKLGDQPVPDNLLKSALALSHASSVAVTIDFPFFVNHKSPANADDGLLGAIAIVMMLQALGKKVDLVVNETLRGPLASMTESLLEQSNYNLVACPWRAYKNADPKYVFFLKL